MPETIDGERRPARRKPNMLPRLAARPVTTAATNREMAQTITLWRPVGESELALIEKSGFRAFPPRLPEQPIFYPVLNFAYAERIARDWNSTENRVGYVTQFQVGTEFLAGYETHRVGDRTLLEYWIPADELPAFNAAIHGLIEIAAEYRNGNRVA